SGDRLRSNPAGDARLAGLRRRHPDPRYGRIRSTERREQDATPALQLRNPAPRPSPVDGALDGGERRRKKNVGPPNRHGGPKYDHSPAEEEPRESTGLGDRIRSEGRRHTLGDPAIVQVVYDPDPSPP